MGALVVATGGAALGVLAATVAAWCRGISWWICRWRSDGNWFPLGI
ncbi:hypothetical protein ACOI4A_13675 [Escherichia coli]